MVDPRLHDLIQQDVDGQLSAADRAELARYCEMAGEPLDLVVDELGSRPSIGEAADDLSTPEQEAYPRAMNVVRSLRTTDAYREVVTEKLAYGADLVAAAGGVVPPSVFVTLAGLARRHSQLSEVDPSGVKAALGARE